MSVEDLMDKSTVKSLSLNNDRTRDPTIKLTLNQWNSLVPFRNN